MNSRKLKVFESLQSGLEDVIGESVEIFISTRPDLVPDEEIQVFTEEEIMENYVKRESIINALQEVLR